MTNSSLLLKWPIYSSERLRIKNKASPIRKIKEESIAKTSIQNYTQNIGNIIS
jgi:hypothetical protein